MKCPRCEYVWEPKVPNPKECPRCKVRLDYVPGPVGAPKLKIEREVKKEMSSRLPWVAATVIIVVAAGLGAWALSTPSTTVNPSTGGAGTATGVFGGIAQGLIENTFADNKSGIGIENIYIIDFMDGENGQNFRDQPTAWIVESDNNKSIIYCSGDTAEIPYENTFAIVVAVRIQAENIAYLTKDNMQNVMSFLYGGSEWKENSDDGNLDTVPDANGGEFVFCNNYIDKTASSGALDGYVMMNHVCDNGGAGYVLKAGGSITIQDNFYAWK
jgi:ssRNA-specific RNase YbeY (16S rRNA maturation enzyme)